MSIVWQTIALQGVKCLSLWLYCRWWPQMVLSWRALRSFFKIGGNMMMTTFLYVTFQNIYSFFIGNRVGLVQLGYYTQADKWSKLGVASITQVLSTSFLPALSEVQDDSERYRRAVTKMNRFTAYLLFPCMVFLIVVATPMFHVLFGTKWDASIILFQLLLIRGIFAVLSTLYNNYILSLGHSRAIFWLEVLRDGACTRGNFAGVAVYLAVDLRQCGVWTDDIALGAGGRGSDNVDCHAYCDGTAYRPGLVELCA